MWPDFTFRFRRRTREFAPADYHLEPAAAPEPQEAVA
jgi:hypothetical protein